MHRYQVPGIEPAIYIPMPTVDRPKKSKSFQSSDNYTHELREVLDRRKNHYTHHVHDSSFYDNERYGNSMPVTAEDIKKYKYLPPQE